MVGRTLRSSYLLVLIKDLVVKELCKLLAAAREKRISDAFYSR